MLYTEDSFLQPGSSRLLYIYYTELKEYQDIA